MQCKCQNEPKTKTLRFSYGMAEGDFATRIRQAASHVHDGHRVRLEMRLKGRQNAHIGLALDKLDEALQRILLVLMRQGDTVRVEKKPTLDGKIVLAQLHSTSSMIAKSRAKQRKVVSTGSNSSFKGESIMSHCHKHKG